MFRTPTVDRKETLAAELGLSVSFVHHVIRKLKEATRIASAPRVAPALTSRDLARMLLGLAATTPLQSTLAEHKLGSLPRTAGDGATTAETELVDLLDEASGTIGGDIDFSSGDILLSADGHFMMVSAETNGGAILNRIYRRSEAAPGMRRIVQIPLPTIRRIAKQLL